MRPAPGSAVAEPRDLRSRQGVLRLSLTIHNYQEADGSVRYCYLLDDGTESPTLRLHPGELLILQLKNDLVDIPVPAASAQSMPMAQNVSIAKKMSMGPAASPAVAVSLHRAGLHEPRDPCGGMVMSPVATNLHFHGLTVPARCHEDDVLMTSVLPGEPPFEYRFRIPADEPPGLYWYHPHIHGYDSPAVLGGASGALIIEGIERAVPMLAGLSERVLVIRDLDLLNPNAPPSKSEPVVPKMLIDRDGDAANNGTGFGIPAKDLSINFVPVPSPDYPPALIHLRPGERELWRVVNASTVTYLNLALLYGGNHVPQRLGVVAIDGVPLHFGGSPAPPVAWVDHIGLPPGARAEIVMTGPPAGVPALFVTRTVDSGQGGENDPNRAVAALIATPGARESGARLPLQANEPFLRDTVNVPYYNGHSLTYPSVRLRMDFRDPNMIGTFVYHCHLMEHSDGGMMGMIRVDPPPSARRPSASGELKRAS